MPFVLLMKDDTLFKTNGLEEFSIRLKLLHLAMVINLCYRIHRVWTLDQRFGSGSGFAQIREGSASKTDP